MQSNTWRRNHNIFSEFRVESKLRSRSEMMQAFACRHVIAVAIFVIVAAALHWPTATKADPGGGAARNSEIISRDSFDEDRIIVRFTPSALDAAEAALSIETRNKGSIPQAIRKRMSRLDSLANSIRLASMQRASKTPTTSRARTAGPSRAEKRRNETFTVAIVKGRDIHEVLKEVRSHSDVVQAQLNYVYRPDLAPTDPEYPTQYAHALTEAEFAWDLETGDPGVIIAIIGTGVELLHPDLSANIWVNAAETPANGVDDDLNGFIDDVHGWDFKSGDDDPTPVGDWHETEVAGVAGAVANNAEGIAGVAWDCRIMTLRVNYTSLDVADAIDYATENGASVINMSFGNYDPAKYGPDTIVQDAVDDAFAAGVVLVATAGNNTTDGMRFPAALDPVIAVSATTATDARASFSNYGSWVTVAAPGDAILSTSGPTDYDTVDGTSFSAPYVAGIAALLLSADGTLTPTNVRNRIMYSVDKITTDFYIGTGRVNLANALALTSDPDLFAIISSPIGGGLVNELTPVTGIALGDDYVLEYRLLGTEAWTFLSSGFEILEGELGVLDGSALDSGIYELRLTAYRGALAQEHLVEVVVNGVKAGWPQTLTGNIIGSPTYSDLDSDGNSEIFVASASGQIMGFYSDGSGIPGWPVEIGASPYGSPAIGDIDGDGEPDIVQGSHATGSVYAFDASGNALPNWPQNLNETIQWGGGSRRSRWGRRTGRDRSWFSSLFWLRYGRRARGLQRRWPTSGRLAGGC